MGLVSPKANVFVVAGSSKIARECIPQNLVSALRWTIRAGEIVNYRDTSGYGYNYRLKQGSGFV